MRTILLAFALISTTCFSQTQIGNADFESWTGDPAPKDRPTGWNQLNHTLPSPLDAFVPQTCFKVTPGYNSATCLRTLTVSTFQGPANGIATTGTIDYTNQLVNGGVAFTDRPDSLTGYYKCQPSTADNGTVEVTLLDLADDTVGRALFSTPGTDVTTWTYFSVPFVYVFTTAPDLAVALVSSSNGYTAVVGSEITVDQLNLVYNPASINENNGLDIDVFSYSNEIFINLEKSNLNDVIFEIYDVAGKLITTKNLNAKSLNRIHLTENSGIYIYKIKSDGHTKSGKLLINQ